MTKGKTSKPAATTNPTPRRGGLVGTMVTTNAETWEALEDGLGTKNPTFNMNLFARTSRTAYVFQGDDVHPPAEEAFNQTATLVAIKAFKPTDPVEAMIAAQAVMMHNLAMEAGRRAQLPQQNSDTASRLRKDAANSARCMTDMVDALARYRGKGPQVVRVERVVVNEGGQAIVGNVTAASLPTSAPAPRVVGPGPAPMPVVDALAVPEMARGEGEQ